MANHKPNAREDHSPEVARQKLISFLTIKSTIGIVLPYVCSLMAEEPTSAHYRIFWLFTRWLHGTSSSWLYGYPFIRIWAAEYNQEDR
jgi:hypothetical protein